MDSLSPTELRGLPLTKNDNDSSDHNRNATHGWPGVSIESLGNKLVKKGTNFVAQSRELLLNELDTFLEVYSNRPDKVNLCGIRINHAYALYITIKALQPATIVESGVNAGQSTYFMRAAASEATIIAIDPLDKPICGQEKRWIDEKNTQYYTGKKFQDVGQIDWAKKIETGEVDPDRTLVFLDDHLRVFDRLHVLMKYGFSHVLLEDNYKVNEGATGHDKAGWTPKQMMIRTDKDAQFLWNNLVSYAEFPPLVSPILCAEKGSHHKRKPAGGFLHYKDTNDDIVAPILRPELDKGDSEIYHKITQRLSIDPDMADKESYMQLMNYNQIAYFQLAPMSPYLMSKQ